MRMKTTTLTLPTYSFIDTAPLAARYDVLAQAVLAFIAAGRLGHALKVSHKIVRLILTLMKLEAQNAQLKRKLDMFSHKPWRDCVLRELGGMRTLKLWDAAYKRTFLKAAAPHKTPKSQDPAWLFTAERIAESERLKARKREVFRAGHNPLIMRDRFKVDSEGEFRLAPLPRGERAARQMRVYTQSSIVEYDWNPMPFQTETGFGPACVWPVEFYAAMEIEAEILAGRETENHFSLSSPRMRGPRMDNGQQLGPRLRGDDGGEMGERNDRKTSDAIKSGTIPIIPLNDVLTPKERQDLFGTLPQEAPLVGS